MVRFRELRRDDDGLSIIEVLVALLVFAFIAAAMGVTLASTIRGTQEARLKEVAANLASSKLDELLAIDNTVDLDDVPTTTTTVDGLAYTVTTSVGWVTSTGSTEPCGTGGGTLLFKRANVSVTWPNMGRTPAVTLGTVLAPSERVNDPAYGTILVRVYGYDGTPRSSVTVTVSPASGSPAITTTIDPTDAQGCSYVLKVSPGTYTIGVKRSGYLDVNQAAEPSLQRTVTAGGAVTASFEFDQAASIAHTYATNVAGAAPRVPTNMGMTYVSGSRTSTIAVAASPTTRYPFAAGYQLVAGSSPTCAAHDPANWPETTTLAAGQRGPVVSSSPGAGSTAAVPMGVITVKPTSTGTITAEQKDTGSGLPGCTTKTTYTFGSVAGNTEVRLALPYGTYQIKTSGSGSLVVNVVGGTVSVVGDLLGGGLPGNSTSSGTTVTLDPRAAK